MTPTDLATLPVWAADELQRQAEEIAALRAALEGADAESTKIIDHAIFLGINRDQCTRERDAYKAERDALAARVAALEAALQPAWEADEGATAGEWRAVPMGFNVGKDGVCVEPAATEVHPFADVVAKVGVLGCVRTAQQVWGDARLIAAAVNAVRAAREVPL